VEFAAGSVLVMSALRLSQAALAEGTGPHFTCVSSVKRFSLRNIVRMAEVWEWTRRHSCEG